MQWRVDLGLSLNFSICGNILKLFGPLKSSFLFFKGKIQIKGQFAENQTLSNDNGVGFSETKCEILILSIQIH